MEPRSSSRPATTPDAGILDLWQGVIVGLGPLAAASDRRWCPRRRVVETLRVLLFVFLLVGARRQGYTTTLAELWAPCRALDAPLPQPPCPRRVPSSTRTSSNRSTLRSCAAPHSPARRDCSAAGRLGSRRAQQRTLAALAQHPEGRLPRRRA